MKIADAEQEVSNIMTHGTPNPEKPVTRLRAGLRERIKKLEKNLREGKSYDDPIGGVDPGNHGF